MTRDELCALPWSIAAGIFFDCLDEETVAELARKEAPKRPDKPRYDTAFAAGGGMVKYASECTLGQLHWFRERSQRSVDSGGEWADKDRKLLALIEKWIAWRVWYPAELWAGKREDEEIVAAPPSDRPKAYPRSYGGGKGGNGGGRQLRQQSQQQDPTPPPDDYFGDDGGSSSNGSSSADDDDIPF